MNPEKEQPKEKQFTRRTFLRLTGAGTVGAVAAFSGLGQTRSATLPDLSRNLSKRDVVKSVLNLNRVNPFQTTEVHASGGGTDPYGGRAGETNAPQFRLGFNDLRIAMAEKDAVGLAPIDNENHDTPNGDGLQHALAVTDIDAKTGKPKEILMVWRKADNWTAATDGYQTWINGPTGLVKRLNSERFSWEGEVNSGSFTIRQESLSLKNVNPDGTVNQAAIDKTQLAVLQYASEHPYVPKPTVNQLSTSTPEATDPLYANFSVEGDLQRDGIAILIDPNSHVQVKILNPASFQEIASLAKKYNPHGVKVFLYGDLPQGDPTDGPVPQSQLGNLYQRLPDYQFIYQVNPSAGAGDFLRSTGVVIGTRNEIKEIHMMLSPFPNITPRPIDLETAGDTLGWKIAQLSAYHNPNIDHEINAYTSSAIKFGDPPSLTIIIK